MDFELTCLLFVINLVGKVCCISVYASDPAFIQHDTFAYQPSNLQLVPAEFEAFEHDKDLMSSLKFRPPALNFGDNEVGVSQMRRVIVINPNDEEVKLLSISGSTSHFHCSFFRDKVIRPGSNTTFELVFLAREAGKFVSELYIHTSHGAPPMQTAYVYKSWRRGRPSPTETLALQVQGVGVRSPYRIRPFIGARVPVNLTYSALVVMHNPHPSPLHIKEVYSSDGDLHLEMPRHNNEAKTTTWSLQPRNGDPLVLQPYETKPIVRARYVCRTENNLTAYIRIQTDTHGESKSEDAIVNRTRSMLVLPVELEVSAEKGLYADVDSLDFGLLRSTDDPKVLTLNLYNSHTKGIHINSVSVVPQNSAVIVDFQPNRVPPTLFHADQVAKIAFNASEVTQPEQLNGSILVKSRNSRFSLFIPYRADVLGGLLSYNKSRLWFYSGKGAQNESRSFSIRNLFNCSVVIYNATIPHAARHYFSLLNFTSPITLEPRQKRDIFTALYHPHGDMEHFRCNVTLATNISTFNVELIVYNGKLEINPTAAPYGYSHPNGFNFGHLNYREPSSVVFSLVNTNPVPVVIEKRTCNAPYSSFVFLGIEPGNDTKLSRPPTPKSLALPITVPPGHFALWNVTLVGGDRRSYSMGTFEVRTNFEQPLRISFVFRVTEGTIRPHPNPLVIRNAFPGKVSRVSLNVNSTYDERVTVENMEFERYNPAMRFFGRDSVEIDASTRYYTLGQIEYDPSLICKNECYVGLPTHWPAGHQWLLGLMLDQDVAETDRSLYQVYSDRWQAILRSNRNVVKETVIADTSNERNFRLNVRAELTWPKVALGPSTISFPLTQIGNLSIATLPLHNPTAVPVLVQLVPLHEYPNSWTLMSILRQKISNLQEERLELSDLDAFFLHDLHDHNSTEASRVRKLRAHIERRLGVTVNHRTIGMLLEAGGKVNVKLGFRPDSEEPTHSVVIIRNNLTIIEAVKLEGKGGQGRFMLSTVKPRSTLKFDITEHHLKNCDQKHQKSHQVPSFTVKRSFRARSTGQLPVKVTGIMISGLPCEGYGFRVFDCFPFTLPANSSRSIDIAFTPDFTLSSMHRILTIVNDIGPPLNYTLKVTLPSHMLHKCNSVLPRPSWERWVYFSALICVSLLVICVMLAVYFEADRIFQEDLWARRTATTFRLSTPDVKKQYNNAPTQRKQMERQREQGNNGERKWWRIGVGISWVNKLISACQTHAASNMAKTKPNKKPSSGKTNQPQKTTPTLEIPPVQSIGTNTTYTPRRRRRRNRHETAEAAHHDTVPEPDDIPEPDDSGLGDVVQADDEREDDFVYVTEELEMVADTTHKKTKKKSRASQKESRRAKELEKRRAVAAKPRTPDSSSESGESSGEIDEKEVDNSSTRDDSTPETSTADTQLRKRKKHSTAYRTSSLPLPSQESSDDKHKNEGQWITVTKDGPSHAKTVTSPHQLAQTLIDKNLNEHRITKIRRNEFETDSSEAGKDSPPLLAQQNVPLRRPSKQALTVHAREPISKHATWPAAPRIRTRPVEDQIFRSPGTHRSDYWDSLGHMPPSSLEPMGTRGPPPIKYSSTKSTTLPPEWARGGVPVDSHSKSIADIWNPEPGWTSEQANAWAEVSRVQEQKRSTWPEPSHKETHQQPMIWGEEQPGLWSENNTQWPFSSIWSGSNEGGVLDLPSLSSIWSPSLTGWPEEENNPQSQ